MRSKRVTKKTLEALDYMVSQGRFELPTFPLGGAKFSGVYNGPPEKGLHQRVSELLGAGQGIRATARYAGFSTTTALKSAMK